MPHADICLFTSIRPPAGAEATSYLRDCLNSWRTAGFDTVAVNGPTATEALRCLDLPVQFAVTTADGNPRIGPILSALRTPRLPLPSPLNSHSPITPLPHPPP